MQAAIFYFHLKLACQMLLYNISILTLFKMQAASQLSAVFAIQEMLWINDYPLQCCPDF